MLQENKNGLYVISFIIGVLVGLAAALLLAPQTGEETRGVILEKSSEIKEKASNSAREVLQSTRTQAGELANTAREKVSQLTNPAQQDTTQELVEPDGNEVELDETVAA
ncbi:MAG: YtxH domain-containing protein [Anaerolineae bacterium]|jgi:gas vesicle protein